MKNHPELHIRSPILFRLTAIGLGLCMFGVGAIALYALWEALIPLYGRLYRNAPVVETPLMAFLAISAIPVTPVIVVTSVYCAWTGRKFDPPVKSWLYAFQLRSYQLTLAMMCAAPVIIAVTCATLLARDYWSCPKLRISGSGWQMFWVNDERVCFTPDSYINDHWPCKVVGNKNICVQVDGR